MNGYCLNIRTKPPEHPYIEDMDVPQAIKDIAMSDDLTDGLVLVSGETGHGKTTTGVAITVSRLKKYGGHCNAYEDPPEYDFQGFHGDNGCAVQTDVKGKFEPYITTSLRKFPITDGSILYVGEIRDLETAKVALQASAQGNLVIGTIHAMNIISTFKRLVSWASDGSSSTDVAADMLSSSFRFIYHQNKTRNPKGEGWKKFNIDGEVFFALNDRTKESIASAIRDGKFDSLKNIIDQQNIKCAKYNEGNLSLEELTNA